MRCLAVQVAFSVLLLNECAAAAVVLVTPEMSAFGVGGSSLENDRFLDTYRHYFNLPGCSLDLFSILILLSITLKKM